MKKVAKILTGIAGNNYLLDTSIAIAYFRHDKAIQERFKGLTFHISTIALGELYLGAYKSAQTEKTLKQIHDLVSLTAILACDAVTAEHYGKIKSILHSKGRPIPENDV